MAELLQDLLLFDGKGYSLATACLGCFEFYLSGQINALYARQTRQRVHYLNVLLDAAVEGLHGAKGIDPNGAEKMSNVQRSCGSRHALSVRADVSSA